MREDIFVSWNRQTPAIPSSKNPTAIIKLRNETPTIGSASKRTFADPMAEITLARPVSTRITPALLTKHFEQAMTAEDSALN
jgi:hypothetical protein